MKIMSFNEVNSFNSIIDDLGDICLEFQDNVLLFSIFKDPFYIEIIKFHKYKRVFNPIESKDVIKHIIDYMYWNGYTTKILVPKESYANVFKEIGFNELDANVYTLQLLFNYYLGPKL